MTDLWSVLLQTLTASGAAALLLAVKALFRDKLSPRWQFGIWGLLALVLLLPAGAEGRYVLFPWPLWVEAAKTALTGDYALTRVLAPVPLPRDLGAPESLWEVLYLLYLAGVVLLLGWYILTYLQLRLALRRGRPAGEEQVRRVAAAYGLTPCRAVAVPGLPTAFVCGVVRPVLALPEGVEVDDKVILHELLHLRHRDAAWGLLICLFRCLHWCNPLLWYCWNRAQNDSEALCDQRVLERLEGEQRREYGVILLSMAEDKYARAPGTTSMANGGRNIKDRIGAIARFKRYPRGVALGARCVAVVLAVTCLAGTGGAVAVPEYDQRGSFAMTAAMLNRPTTVAGALDTYAKAVLCDSPVYFAMVTPEKERAQVVQAVEAPFEEVDLNDSLFWELNFHWSRPAWQAEWSVMNLLADGAGGYTGVLFFTPFSHDETQGLVYQSVAIRPLGDYWTVEPVGELTLQLREDWWLCPSTDTPYATYTAEGEGLYLEVDFQCRLWGDSTVWDTSYGSFSFSDSGYLDPKPLPHLSFTQLRTGVGARLVFAETGEAVSLPITVAPMQPGEDPLRALEESFYTFTLNPGSLDEDPVQASTGITSGTNLTLTEMPAALAVAVEDGDRTYICVALPEEVVP